MIKLALSLLGGLAGGVGKGAMGLLGGLGLGKIQLIVLAFLVATIVGQGIALKFTLKAKDQAIAVAAAEQAAHAATKGSFDHYRAQTELNQQNQLEAMDQLNSARHEARKEADQLSRLLRKHDLGHLARKKPGMIERRINQKTEEAFKKIWWSWDPWTPKKELDYETRWFLYHIEHYGWPCWLLYAAYDRDDPYAGLCALPPRVSTTPQTSADASDVPGPGGETRDDVRRDNKEKPSADMPKRPKLRDTHPWFQRYRKLLA